MSRSLSIMKGMQEKKTQIWDGDLSPGMWQKTRGYKPVRGGKWLGKASDLASEDGRPWLTVGSWASLLSLSLLTYKIETIILTAQN